MSQDICCQLDITPWSSRSLRANRPSPMLAEPSGTRVKKREPTIDWRGSAMFLPRSPNGRGSCDCSERIQVCFDSEYVTKRNPVGSQCKDSEGSKLICMAQD